MGEYIKCFCRCVWHFAVAKVYTYFPSKIEDVGIHLLEVGINGKKCAKIVNREDIENKANLVIDIANTILRI